MLQPHKRHNITILYEVWCNFSGKRKKESEIASMYKRICKKPRKSCHPSSMSKAMASKKRSTYSLLCICKTYKVTSCLLSWCYSSISLLEIKFTHGMWSYEPLLQCQCSYWVVPWHVIPLLVSLVETMKPRFMHKYYYFYCVCLGSLWKKPNTLTTLEKGVVAQPLHARAKEDGRTYIILLEAF